MSDYVTAVLMMFMAYTYCGVFPLIFIPLKVLDRASLGHPVVDILLWPIVCHRASRMWDE